MQTKTPISLPFDNPTKIVNIILLFLMFMCPSKSPWLFILGNARGWGGGASWAWGLSVRSIAWIRPWSDKPHVHISVDDESIWEPTFHPGIKGSHRIWSTCLIDVITHTVALCTRSQWQIYNGDPTRKTALLVLTFGLCFLTSSLSFSRPIIVSFRSINLPQCGFTVRYLNI